MSPTGTKRGNLSLRWRAGHVVTPLQPGVQNGAVSGYAKRRAHARIRAASSAGLDVAGFLDEASAALASAVPNENHMNGPYWYTLDPESRLITSDYGGEGCQLDTSDVMRWEYLDDDVNKYSEVLGHSCGVQTLHEVTRGKPERSRIYREYMAIEGIAQEMLVALGSCTGMFWGTVRLNRLHGQPAFDADELAFMAAVAPDLAEGIRRGLVVGEAMDPDRPDVPGLIILDADGEIVSLSAGATRWIERLRGRSARGSLPASIASAASAALACARGEDPAGESTVLVRSVDGCWISVHGMVIAVGRTPKAAVMIDPAHPDRLTPLLMAIHGLTPREREVTRLVLQGRSTTQLANRLEISPHTVQQHLKSIFEKVGVRSRRELVGALFFENFEPRVQDNGQRVSVEKPIRGGPLRRVH
jgi:DNA-binding CsgD family transcriptional regulator